MSEKAFSSRTAALQQGQVRLMLKDLLDVINSLQCATVMAMPNQNSAARHIVIGYYVRHASHRLSKNGMLCLEASPAELAVLLHE